MECGYSKNHEDGTQMTKAWETLFNGNDLKPRRTGYDVSFWPYFVLSCKALSSGQRVGMQLLPRLGFTISHQRPKYKRNISERINQIHILL